MPKEMQVMGSANNSQEQQPHPNHFLPEGRLNKPGYQLSKTILDYLIALPALLLLLPLYFMIAALIRLDSPGSVFTRRSAVGRHGREFTAYHFRTTRPENSLRQTTIGQQLDRYGLTDLPLLINVLKRDMSLIGPRLASPIELADYGRYRPTILEAYPGLTGLWQISHCRENRLQRELTYVQRWSIWLDLKILFLTVPAVINQPC
jgi:lipopolysaccharide/colanic/teichoic acid biosynthesis glycosyltransferase